jgi:hypothetical protein
MSYVVTGALCFAAGWLAASYISMSGWTKSSSMASRLKTLEPEETRYVRNPRVRP